MREPCFILIIESNGIEVSGSGNRYICGQKDLTLKETQRVFILEIIKCQPLILYFVYYFV